MKALSLSIVIPVYNEEHHIRACLDAIAAQTVRPDEVIVVDNNSTDRSMEIVQEYPFVRIVREPRQGIVYTRNAGFDAAKCAIIGRIDGDTVLPVNWVARVKWFYANSSNANACLTGGGYFYNIRMPRFNGWMQSQLAYRVNRFITGHYILWGSNMAFPRSAWRDIRSNVCDRDDIHEDVDLGIHAHQAGYPIHYDASLRVGVKLKRVKSSRKDLRRHMRRWPLTLRVHGYHLWWLGVVGNVFLWFVVQPFMIANELLARMLGRQSIID